MKKIIFVLAAFLITGCQSGTKKYTFSRMHDADLAKGELRGGTTDGPELTYDDSTNKYFAKISNVKTKKEKDRMAILAQTGEYQVSFEFMETLGYAKDYKFDKPYFSWATEFVVPIVEKDDFISLQHILVMKLKGMEPYVVKHWRQDWTYEKTSFIEYVGYNTWEKTKLKKSDAKGTWTQEVYQVDDSPRYASYGAWSHYEDHSQWVSHITKRPLPRREYTVRSDYQLLKGINRVTVMANRWIHEQDNEKVVIDPQSKKEIKILAREIGVNRYRKIKDFDFSVGKDYWVNTAPYWEQVRNKWDNVIKTNNTIKLKTENYGQKLYKIHFEFADKINKGEEKLIPENTKKHAQETIQGFLVM